MTSSYNMSHSGCLIVPDFSAIFATAISVLTINYRFITILQRYYNTLLITIIIKQLKSTEKSVLSRQVTQKSDPLNCNRTTETAHIFCGNDILPL